MLKLRLREVMDAYRIRTGTRLTYEALAQASGLSVATIQSLAARPSYNTTLSTVERLCTALGCQPGELLEFVNNNEEREEKLNNNGERDEIVKEGCRANL